MIILNTIMLCLFISISFELGTWIEKRKHTLPFKWSCMEDGCIFNISSSEWPTLMFLADGHLSAKHDIEQE